MDKQLFECNLATVIFPAVEQYRHQQRDIQDQWYFSNIMQHNRMLLSGGLELHFLAQFHAAITMDRFMHVSQYNSYLFICPKTFTITNIYSITPRVKEGSLFYPDLHLPPWLNAQPITQH